jgi:hypothetical protein
MTGDQLKAKDAEYTVDQVSAMIYITAAASPTTAKTINVTSVGYYFFDGTIWQKIGIPYSATYGTQVLLSEFNISSTNFQDVGLQVTLPTPGTYSVRATANGHIVDGSTVGNLITARFVDGLNNSQGQIWTVVGRDGESTTATTGYGSGTGELIITITTPTVIKLQAKVYDTAASTKKILAGGSSGGETYMIFHKIAGN